MKHQPVLLDEAVAALAIRADGHYIDATFGRGGHSTAILERLGQQGMLLAIDQDPQAIAAGQALVAQYSQLHLHHAGFDRLASLVEAENLLGSIDGILLDLGVSSPQLD